MKKLRRVKGYTLMELLITVAIVGILAAMSIPAFGTAVDIALGAVCRYNQRYLESLLGLYLGENNQSFVAADLSGINETTIMFDGASSVDVSRTLASVTKDLRTFECPAARYYKVGGSLNGHYVTDGYVIACATDNRRSYRSDGDVFSLDTPHSWGNRSWNHVRD